MTQGELLLMHSSAQRDRYVHTVPAPIWPGFCRIAFNLHSAFIRSYLFIMCERYLRCCWRQHNYTRCFRWAEATPTAFEACDKHQRIDARAAVYVRRKIREKERDWGRKKLVKKRCRLFSSVGFVKGIARFLRLSLGFRINWEA